MRFVRASRAIALSIVLAGTAAGPVLAEQVGTFPINPSQVTTEGTYFTDNDPGDFVLRDASTGAAWQFRSADPGFHQLLMDLNRVANGNVTQFAYVGNAPGQGPVSHGSWLAPLSAGNQASQYSSARAPDGAVSFDPQALNVQQTDDGYVLTAGSKTIAETSRYDGSTSLDLLKQMIQTYNLNTAWKQSGSAETPVASGPVTVFLKVDGTTTACANRWSSVRCMLGS